MFFSNKRFLYNATILALFIFSLPLGAQNTFEVIGLEGRATIQRGNERTELSPGERISDNDLVETHFQSRLTARLGDNNLIILGSNSNTLFNISETQEDDSPLVEANFTLFAGGIFARAESGCILRIYTSNAVAETQYGAISTVVEARTGETGIQVLGGTASARNIAQQRGIELNSGFTTMIHPGREPTAPLYMTMRHVTVLRHFFGEEYISSQLTRSGINPTQERSGTGRLSMSQTAAGRDSGDEEIHGPLFSEKVIWGAILNDKYSFGGRWRPVEPLSDMDRQTFIGLNTGISGAYSTNPHFLLLGGFNFSFMSLGLSFRGLTNADGEFVSNFSSLDGLLAFIDYVTIGSDRNYLRLGSFENLTYGNGLIVNNFRTFSPNHVFKPLALKFQFANVGTYNLGGFLQNIFNPSVGGINLELTPGVYRFSAGYYFDFDQHDIFKDKVNSRFIYTPSPDSIVFRNENQTKSALQIVESGFETELFHSYNFTLRTSFDYAFLIHNGRRKGKLFRAPAFSFDWNGIEAGLGLITESGHMISAQFNGSYIGNRAHLFYSEPSGVSDTLVSQNMQLSSERKSQGIFAGFRINPVSGSSVEAYFKHDYKNSVYSGSDNDSTISLSADFSFDLRLSINDTLLSFCRYASVFIRQSNGTLFSDGSTYFNSPGFEYGFEVITKPLFLNLSFMTQGRFYYINSGKMVNDSKNGLKAAFDAQMGVMWEF
ncbi:hypothetical protein CHISP_0354 [Chitinispirillum alkaliphilum]|nr:hypothetical protein CHISP_0354 [Chitinispirillum alkaliphilum]